MVAVLMIEELPDCAVEAAARFYSHYLPPVLEALEHGASALAICLPPAAQDHDDWRRAVARDLARAHAPKIVNCVSGHNGPTLDAILAYLADAPGLTGQYLKAHDTD